MSRRPLSPEVWEQALVNGRRIHPSDSEAATAWSESWYVEQGGHFNDEVEAQPAAPEPDPLMPVENTMSDEAFEALVLQSEHEPGPEPEAHVKPEAEGPKRPSRRVRRQG